MFQGSNPRQSLRTQLPSFGQIVSTSLSPPSQQHPFGSSGNAAGFGNTAAFGSSSSNNVAGFGNTAAFGSGSSTNAAGFGSTPAFGSGSSTNAAGFGSATAFGSSSTNASFGSTTAFGSGSSTNAASFGSTTAFGSNSTNTAGFGTTTAFGSSSPNTVGFGSTATFGSGSSTNAAGFGSTAAFGSSSPNAAGFGSTATFGSSSSPNAAGFGSTAAFGSGSTNAAGFGSTTAFGSGSTNAAGFGSTSAFGSSGSGDLKTTSFSTNTFPPSSTSSPPDQMQTRPSAFTPDTSLPKPLPPPQSNPSAFTASTKSQNVASSGGRSGTDTISFARVAADHPPTGIFSVKSEKNPFGSGASITVTTSSSVFENSGGQNPFGRSSSIPSAFSASKAEPQILVQPVKSTLAQGQAQSQKSVFSSSHPVTSTPRTKGSNLFLNSPTDNVFSRSQTSSSAAINPPPPAILPSTAFGVFVSNNSNSSSAALPSTGFGSPSNSKTVLSTATTTSSPFTSPVTLPSTTTLLPTPPSFTSPLTQQTGSSATFSKSVFGSSEDSGSSSPVLGKSSAGSFLPFNKNSNISSGGSSSSSSIHGNERSAFKGGTKSGGSAFAAKSNVKVFGGVPLTESKRSSASVSAGSDPTVSGVGLFGKAVEKHPSFSKTKTSSSRGSSTVNKYSTEMSAPPSPPSKIRLFGKRDKSGTRPEERTASASTADSPAIRTSLAASPSSASKLRADASFRRDPSFLYIAENEEDSDDSELSIAQRAVSSSRMAMDKMSKVPMTSRYHSRITDSTGRLASSRKRISLTDDARYRKAPKSWNEYDLMRSSSRSKMSRSAMRQRQLSEELESHPALVCKNIPPEYNQVPYLRNHFSKYGVVERVSRNLAKNGANIHFRDHKSAVLAKQKGFKLASGVHIQIFWHSNPRRRSMTSYVDLDTEPPDENKRRGHLLPLPTPRRSTSPAPSPSTSGRRDRQPQPSWMSNEVEEELRLMAGTSDISGDYVQTVVRREELEAPPATQAKAAATTTASIATAGASVVPASSPSQKFSSPSRRHQIYHHHHHHHQHHQQEHHHRLLKLPAPAPAGVPGKGPASTSAPGSSATTHRKWPLFHQPRSSSTASSASSASTSAADTKKSVIGPASPSTVRSYSSVVSGQRTASVTTTTTTAPITTTPTATTTTTTTPASLFRKSEHASTVFSGFHGDTEIQKANVTNSASRVQLLDQRDRSIRNAGLKKKSNLATAKILIGACPDMCPEKERYDREAKRRLHMFEILPATKMLPYPQVDHARAVKEYSRSSADQEEPLIHELRPGPVLVRTMNYLLSEIANMGQDGLWAEWFDFLWDRSRGIRKDITQQMMCNGDAVALIEKCVRFHVFASERLCEEDISVFSPKINNENLTKCLQSLKYLYADLDKKKKIHFDTEAEFRSYMVLMNLNQGDILREVQTLRPEVRNSPEIHFALQVYSALNSNNYIKFFKLARTATFLSCCIIHRYFMQVRSKALRILRKALTFGTKPVMYPLTELVRTLCFESTNEAGTFCKHYGFTVEGSDVLIDRSSFIEPEMAPCLVRAVSFIESKCTRPIGEVINGGPLQPVELPIPTNSFDEDGNLKQETLSKEALQSRKVPHTVEMEVSECLDTARRVPPETVKQATPCDMPQAEASEETMWQGSEATTSNAEMPLDPTSATAQQQQLEQQQQPKASKSTMLLKKEIAKDLFLEVIATFAKEISQELFEKSEQLRDVASDVHRSISDEVVNREMSDIEKELHDQLVEECCQRLNTEILNEVVGEMCATEVNIFYRNDVELRLEALHEAEYCVQLYKMSKVIDCWKRRLSKRQHDRDMTMFPSWPSVAPLDKQLKTLCGKEHEGVVGDALAMTINQTARLSMETPLAISRQDDYLPLALSLCHMRRHLIQQKAWYPLDLAATVGPSLLASSNWDTQTCKGISSGSLYWKLIMSLPELNEEQTDDATMYSQELSDWLKAKLSKGAKPHSDVENMSVLSLYKCRLEDASAGGQPRDPTLHFCLRRVSGSLTPDLIQQVASERLFCGTSGFLFVLPLLGKNDDEENYWLEAQIRLSTLLQAKPPQPSLPIAVLVPHDESDPCSPIDLEEIREELNVSHLIKQGLVSAVDVFALPFQCHSESGFDVEHVAVETVLSNCLKWLAAHLPAQPKLEKKFLKDFIEDFLTSNFYGPLLYNKGLRSVEGYLQQPPDVIIDFYNSILEHLTDCATDPVLTSYSWPVTEFVDAEAQGSNDNDLPPVHWNSPEHLQFVGDTLQSLALPPFSYGEETSEKWSQAQQDVWSYVQTVSSERSGKSAVDLVSRVRHHIYQVEKQFDEVCRRLKFGVSNCPPTYVNMPWVDIILDCINHCLTTVSCLDPRSTNTVKATELCVLYEKEKLHSYEPSQSWSEAAIAEKNMKESCNLESTFYRSIDLRSKEMQETLSAKKALHRDKPSGWGSTNNKHHHHQLAETVKASIDAERAKSNGFESFLMQSAMAGDLQYENDTWHSESDWYTEFYHPFKGAAEVGVDDDEGGDSSGEARTGKYPKRKTLFHYDDDGSSPKPRVSKSKPSPYSVSRPEDFGVFGVRDELSLDEKMVLLRDQIDYNKRTDSIMECLLQSFIIDDSFGHDDNNDDDDDDDVLFAEDCG